MTEDETTNLTPTAPPQEEKESVFDLLKEVVRFSAIALLFIVPIRIFIAQPYIVSGASMHPTFESGEYLIVDQLSYRLGAPARGEVVIFRFPQDHRKFFIKRVIGLPGEKIAFKDGMLSVTSKDDGTTILEEKYLSNPFTDSFTRELANDEYFVMGDNRPASLDSRIFGALSERYIVGRAFLRLLPPTRISIFPGAYEYPREVAAQ